MIHFVLHDASDTVAVIVVEGVIDKAEQPTHPGLWFMDPSSAKQRQLQELAP